MCACSTKSEIFPSPRNLEKDVPPSVLSSGGALGPWMVRCIHPQAKSFLWRITGIEPDACAMRTGWSVQSPVRAFVPRHPDHSMEANLAQIGCAPTCEVGCRERFAAQVPTTVSPVDDDQGGPWMRGAVLYGVYGRTCKLALYG
jgi:hypothetical protein